MMPRHQFPPSAMQQRTPIDITNNPVSAALPSRGCPPMKIEIPPDPPLLEAAVAVATLPRHVQQVFRILEYLNLTSFFEVLQSNGYDDVRSLYCLNERDLTEMNFQKGECDRLLRWCQSNRMNNSNPAAVGTTAVNAGMNIGAASVCGGPNSCGTAAGSGLIGNPRIGNLSGGGDGNGIPQRNSTSIPRVAASSPGAKPMIPHRDLVFGPSSLSPTNSGNTSPCTDDGFSIDYKSMLRFMLTPGSPPTPTETFIHSPYTFCPYALVSPSTSSTTPRTTAVTHSTES